MGKETESDCGRRQAAGKREVQLGNREEEEDGLEKRETRLFGRAEVEDVEEEQEEDEDEGLAFCVGIGGDKGKSNKSNKS